MQVCEVATDALKMWTSEKLEMEHASATDIPPVDESLQPRRVSMWLLAEYAETQSQLLDLFLDAASVWANTRFKDDRVVNSMRMSAAFGNDAKYVLELCSGNSELVEQVLPLQRGDAMVLLRWHDARSGAVRAACRLLEAKHLSAKLNDAVRCLQDTTVRMTGCFDVPLPTICMKPVPSYPNEQQDLFYTNYASIRDEFFDLLVGTPSINFCPETVRKNASRILQPTGCFVRLCSKAAGKEGMTASSCFHGAIVAFSNKRQESLRFLNQLDDAGALRIPISDDELSLGLHVCAVQVEPTQLKNVVSVYGTCGVAGKPMHVPGSYVWVARPALRPLDAALMNVFSLVPCDRMSMIPARRELISGFERFWMHTTMLFKMVADGAVLRPRSPCQDISSLSNDGPPMDRRDASNIRMMGIEMESPRTTLGDAYAHLSCVDGSESICSNIKLAMATIGVRASLYDMFQLNQASIRSMQQQEDSKRKSEECLMGLCDVALQLAYDCKHSNVKRAKQDPLCLAAERMRRILRACSLKAGTHCTLEPGVGTVELFGDALYDLVTASTWFDSKPSQHVSTLIRKPFPHLFAEESKADKEGFLKRVEACLALSSALALVSLQNLSSMLFFVIGKKTNDEVYIKSVGLDGSTSPSSLDEMCRVTSPRVIVLQELDRNRVRITATRTMDDLNVTAP